MGDDIDTMPAGREIDGLVAKLLMGWRTQAIENPMDLKNAEAWVHGDVALTIHSEKKMTVHAGNTNSYIVMSGPPAFSKDIAKAWSVVDKILGTLKGVSFNLFYYADGNTRATFQKHEEVKSNGHAPIPYFGQDWTAQAPTLPLAICRAALKVVQVKESPAPAPTCEHDWTWIDGIHTSAPAYQDRTCSKCSQEESVQICSPEKPCADCKAKGCRCICHTFRKV